MTRRRFIRILRGAGLEEYGINLVLLVKKYDRQNTYIDVINILKDSLVDGYNSHGTPLPKELRTWTKSSSICS